MNETLSSDAAPSGAMCFNHVGTLAVVTCTRCGNFSGACCMEAVDEVAYCVNCATRIPRLAKPLRRIAAGLIDAWLLFGLVSRAYDAIDRNSRSDTNYELFALAVLLTMAVFLVDVVLIAVRAQTIGMLFFGLRFARPDGEPVGAFRLLVTRFALPFGATFMVSNFPLGVPLAAALNFGCMRPNAGRSLVDAMSKTVVALRKPKSG